MFLAIVLLVIGYIFCNDVTIGMGAVVVKDITEPGIYVGNPARRLK
jgi:serine acetyltransferase